jgi:glyoxylase-like metal-dependent hydrolase (beta-lactamase superfamily II)/ACT domain-containing protein
MRPTDPAIGIGGHKSPDEAPIRVYRLASPPAADHEGPSGTILAKFRVYLPDRPGSLASFATTIARAEGNISFFHYDRSIHSSRVAVEVQLDDELHLERLLDSLKKNQFQIIHQETHDDVLVTAVESILDITVRLANRPGSLAAFARLLSDHDANVIYMLYDEDIDPESAHIAMVTKDPQEIDRLLQAINEQGYHYRVMYRGSDEQEASTIIGLKMVEKFFLRLKKLLPASDIAEIKSLVESSRDLNQDLVHFATEAGNNLEAGDVFETVLTFASRSRSSTGDKFSATIMGPLRFLDRVALWGFRLPTSENFYLFQDKDDLTMIDAGHGIYYGDIKNLIAEQGMEPSRVRRIYITHPDTDHAGASGYFENEFGTQVFMHPGSADVITQMNRAAGATHSGLLNLNKYYTRLSIRFTECRFPSQPRYFSTAGAGSRGPFRVIDHFSIGPLRFDVLESLGGHTPGLVFFLNQEFGLLFTSDFLLNVPSLTAEEKEHLGIYRYLLTNPNRDTRIYKDETAALKTMMLDLDQELRGRGGHAQIFPGHGAYYRADMKL